MRKAVVRTMIRGFHEHLWDVFITVGELKRINEDLNERNNLLAETVEHLNKLNSKLIERAHELIDLNRKTMDRTATQNEELMSIVRHNILTDEQKAKYDKEVEKIDNPPALEIVKPEDDDLV